MWDLPRPGLEPVSPALAGRFLTTAPPGKPLLSYFILLQATCVRVLVVCVFQGTGPFHLTYQVCGHRVVHNIPLLSFDAYGISSDDPSIISDVGNLCLLSFFS